jgi:YVTN family beta-propeller protein
VWATNRGGDSVSVIDVASLKVVATVDSKTFPIRAKFTDDGKHVLVSNAQSGDVAVFDAASRRDVRRIKMQSDGCSPLTLWS